MDTPLASAEHKKNADRNYSSVKKDMNNILNNPRDFELKKVNKKTDWSLPPMKMCVY